MLNKELPTNPGTYLFKDCKGKIIYVGKAKNLKKRVKSYFQKKDHDIKTELLVKSIDDYEYIVTNTEGEALILENNLIKKYKPKYNVNLRDSKRYAYLIIPDEKFPRLLIHRFKTGKGKLFGPFVSAAERNHVRQYLVKTFKLRTCNRLPKRVCLRYHIKLCEGPCVGEISKTEYNKKIERIKMVLKGKSSGIVKKMKEDMGELSKKKSYEKAIILRDQINAILSLNERQTVERQKKYDEDIFNYIVKDDHVYLILFNIYKGTLLNKSEYQFPIVPRFVEQFISQYYSENDIPKEIILPKRIDSEVVDFLRTKRDSVKIIVPLKGEKKQLLELVKKNVEISFFGNVTKLEELQKSLKLNDIPHIIECFDISHLSGTSTVGSMVQFRNGRPDKSNYRRFKIRTVTGIDDFKAIAEVVHRRYKRFKQENSEIPNLIIIDGGKGQLSAAIKELKDLDIQIPIISLAKRLEEVFVPGLKIPIILSKKTKALQFLQQIRDEAHRFAITYNRLLRSKKMIE